MKLSARLSLMGSCLGLIFLTALPSSATVVGTLVTGGPGTVTVTPTGITFTTNDPNNTPPSSTQVGVVGPDATTLTYDGGPPLATGDPIDINGGATITPADLLAGTVDVTFPNEPNLNITLTSFGPGTGVACAPGMTVGQSCSPLGGLSPIVLTDLGPDLTEASLPFAGTAKDLTGTSTVSGLFTQPIGESIESLATASSFTTTYAGTFTFTANAVPEPRTISFIGLACLFMGIVVAKRRKSVA
jgi:hypothetical protein